MSSRSRRYACSELLARPRSDARWRRNARSSGRGLRVSVGPVSLRADADAGILLSMDGAGETDLDELRVPDGGRSLGCAIALLAPPRLSLDEQLLISPAGLVRVEAVLER